MTITSQISTRGGVRILTTVLMFHLMAKLVSLMQMAAVLGSLIAVKQLVSPLLHCMP